MSFDKPDCKSFSERAEIIAYAVLCPASLMLAIYSIWKVIAP